ncbi:MAG: chromophore lyase CpcT/CpeT [Thermoanaerobaculales bacterium]|jgi:hypothetical protein|nr:chromophore lyase CpcT/CpeT [Thermoanaerobaculales bacterium]
MASIAVAATCSLCSGPAAADDPANDLQRLVEWMTGAFSTAVQAEQNLEFFVVDLHAAPIWPDRDDGHWIYVEQAMREYGDRPYRQRIYRLSEPAPGLFEIRIHLLPDPGSAVGAWREESPLAEIDVASLTARVDCSIYLRRRGDRFIGSTLASLCTSTLRGAAYATSEVMVTADGMISWDRGFAEGGSQVWGAVSGGYVFDRIVEDGPASVAEPVAEPVPDDSGSSSGGQQDRDR